MEWRSYFFIQWAYYARCASRDAECHVMLGALPSNAARWCSRMAASQSAIRSVTGQLLESQFYQFFVLCHETRAILFIRHT